MTTVLTPSPKQKFFTNNGAPANKYKLFVYQAGTTTKTTTWTDSTGGSANTNPIILDYRGECNLWISPNVSYKYVLAPDTDTDPPTNAIWTVDNLVSSQLITLYGGVDTGTANNYKLTFTANFSAYADGIVVYWIPANANTSSAVNLNINSLGNVNVVDQNGNALVAGQIQANVIIATMYVSGQWRVVSAQVIKGNFTGTLTGMTATINLTVQYYIINSICTMYINGGSATTGTSNTVAMTMTGIPNACNPFFSRSVLCAVTDNSISVMAQATIGTFNTITFTPIQSAGAFIRANSAFTAAGNKGLGSDWLISYPIV